MNPNAPPKLQRTRFPVVPVLLGLIALIPVLLVLGVLSFFQLSGATSALRTSALESLPGTWNPRVTLHAGFFTTALVRAGSRFFKLPPEAQAGIASLRGAEVSVYKSQGTSRWVDAGTLFTRADKAMSARGWDRAVGVSHDRELVAVYLPRRGFQTESVRCCVLALNRGDLVVAGVSGNINPVLEMVEQRIDLSGPLGWQFSGLTPHHRFAGPAQRHAHAASLQMDQSDL